MKTFWFVFWLLVSVLPVWGADLIELKVHNPTRYRLELSDIEKS